MFSYDLASARTTTTVADYVNYDLVLLYVAAAAAAALLPIIIYVRCKMQGSVSSTFGCF